MTTIIHPEGGCSSCSGSERGKSREDIYLSLSLSANGHDVAVDVAPGARSAMAKKLQLRPAFSTPSGTTSFANTVISPSNTQY
jgi:hypothetical protein